MIKMFEICGLAYDLKTISPEMVMKRKMRTGEVEGKTKVKPQS